MSHGATNAKFEWQGCKSVKKINVSWCLVNVDSL
jgi:hypothetical protein